MTQQAPAAAHGSDTRRHTLVGDVHLILVNALISSLGARRVSWILGVLD